MVVDDLIHSCEEYGSVLSEYLQDHPSGLYDNQGDKNVCGQKRNYDGNRILWWAGGV